MDPNACNHHAQSMNTLYDVVNRLMFLAEAFEDTGNDKVARGLRDLAQLVTSSQKEARAAFSSLLFDSVDSI